MAVQVPPEVNWLFDILCGQSWPEGDEDALRRCADAWKEAALALGDLAGYLDSSAQNVLASADSMSADDYDNFWKNYIHDGDGTYVALFKQCEPLVKQLFAQATEVEYTKIVIVVTLILTAIQIAIAIAAAAGTFGGSLAEIPLALFVSRQAIVMVVARFVEMALMMLIPDLVAQTVMFAQGHGWDGSKTVAAFENALAAGTIAAVLGPLAGKLPWMSEEAAQTIGGKFGALATHFVEGGAVNDLTALATMGTNYGLASLTGNQDWQKQIGQQWSSTNWVAQFAQGGVLADAFYAAHMFGHDGVPMTFTGPDGKSYTVYLNEAAFTSLRDTGQLPADYQARVFGDRGVQVGDATLNGTAISFDKSINGQSGADLGNGFTVAGHDGSQFRFRPSDQAGPDGQPQFDLVARVQKSADPITVPNADPGGDPLVFPPGSVVHYDNVPGPDGTMTGQPYRVEVTDGNVVKIYQAEQPGGAFELTGQVVHSSGILRFFGADAPKYYGPDGQGDGAHPLATVSLITGKSTTNDLAGYIKAHVDRWGAAAPTSPAGAAGPRVVDGAVVTQGNEGQRAAQEADPAVAVGLADASAFAYAQQVQQVQQMLQSHPELFDLVPRGGQSPAPEVPEEPHEWPQLFRTVERGIDVPEDLNGLAETNVADLLAQSRKAYEATRNLLESDYRRDIQAYEDADTSVHTLEKLDQERLDRTARYQAGLQELAKEYQAADRKILVGELQRVRTTLKLLTDEFDPEIADLRTRLQRLTQRIESMQREDGHSPEELRAADDERQQVLLRREELQSVSERRTLLAGAEKHIDDALRNLDDAYRKQMAEIDAGLAQELAQRPHLDLDRIYAADLVRLDREWARAETLQGADRLRRFAELQRQLRDLEVGLSRQHEALRIGPDAKEARIWVRAAFERALKENRARGVPRAEAAARDDVAKSIDKYAARLEAQIDRLTRSTGPGREASPRVGELERTVAELRRLRDIVQADPASSGSNRLYPVSRSIAVPGHPDVPSGFSRVELPADLVRLAGLVHKTQDGLAGYAGSDQRMLELVRQVPGVKGAYLVDMHGDAAGPWDPSSPQLQSRLSVSEVHDLLAAAGWDGDGKQPVVLMSCDAAQSSYAADLAAELGVRVIAPTARVWQVGDRVFICGIDPATGLPDLSRPGHWEEFGGKNPGPAAADEHGMPELDAPHQKAAEADAQQAVNALRVLSDPRAHAPPVPRGEEDPSGYAADGELPRVTNDPGQVSATGEVVLTSAIDGTRPWVLEVGGHSDWLGPAAPVDVGPSDAAWPNVFSYGDAEVRLDLARWPGRMDAVVVRNAADIAERIDVLGTALRPGGLLVLDHGETRALADEGSPPSIWVRVGAKDVPDGYERVYSGPDRLVLRKLGGGQTGEQPHAEPDVGRLIAAVEAKHDEALSLFPSPREIEERWGITQRNQKLIQWIVDKEDALLLMRPGNSESAPMQEAGGVTKPPALKANTINEIDVMLGARDLVGAVGFYRPDLKSAEAAREQLEQAGLWDAVRSRFDRRLEQYRKYNDLWPKIEHLILERKFRVVDGVIYPFDPVPVRHEGGIYGTLRVGEPELDEHGRLVAPVFADDPGDVRLRPVNSWPKFNRALGIPVTGDYDIYHALDAAGEELPFDRPQVPAGEVEPGLWFKKLVDEGFMTQDQIRGKGADAGELLARQMGIQHGAMLVFLRHNEITDWERERIYEPIIKGHQAGGTPLLLFQAGRRPTLVFPEPVPADLSRSPIFDALNPPGGHHNWLAAVHGRDLLPAHLAIEPADVPADLTPLTPPTGLGDLAGLVFARTDGSGVVISSDPEHLAATATGEDGDAFRLYAVGGGGQAWAPGGRGLSPQDLFTLAKEAGWDGSRPLDLVVCEGGAGDDASLAARVQAAARSEFPDAVVRGATTWVWQDPATGERVVAPALWDPEKGLFLPHPRRRGAWVRFPPDDNVAGHAGAPEHHQPAAHWVHWADSTTPHRRDWPADPVTGQPLTHRDLDFLGLTEQQVEWWRSGEAPLGMTPETYHAWTKDLQDALREDGIPPETVDVRLLGSSARGFSGPHKRLPSDGEIAGRYPQEVARAALERKAEWLGEDTQRLQSRPFDSMNKLGLDEPSDYDTNISCDLMVDKARAQWQADGAPGSFLSGDHEYVTKDVARETFPYVRDWADRWSALLGRDVSWAVFPSTGPKDVSASGHFVHFQDDDWIVLTPGDSRDADD